MKRAVLIFLAALFVLLTYPATYSLAKGSNLSDSPSVVSGTDYDGGVILSGDDGDADDLAGARKKTRLDEMDQLHHSSVISGGLYRTFLQAWWNFMVIIR